MKKTLSFSILSLAVAVLTAYATAFNPTAQAWIGIAVLVVTGFLNVAYTSSGTFIGYFQAAQWITIIGGIVLQAMNAIGDGGLIPAHIVNYIVIGVTIIIQQFGKTYPAEAK